MYLHLIYKTTVAGLFQIMFEIEATTDAGVSDDRCEDLRAVDQPPLPRMYLILEAINYYYLYYYYSPATSTASACKPSLSWNWSWRGSRAGSTSRADETGSDRHEQVHPGIWYSIVLSWLPRPDPGCLLYSEMSSANLPAPLTCLD